MKGECEKVKHLLTVSPISIQLICLIGTSLAVGGSRLAASSLGQEIFPMVNGMA